MRGGAGLGDVGGVGVWWRSWVDGVGGWGGRKESFGRCLGACVLLFTACAGVCRSLHLTRVWARAPQSLLRAPPEPAGQTHTLFEAFWLECGPLELPVRREEEAGGWEGGRG